MSKSTLKEVSELITKGTTPSSVGCEFVSEGINFIKSESIFDSKYLNNSIYEHIDIETDKKLKRSRIKEGDLLFSIAGAYLGKIAIVQAKDIPANTNQAVGIVRLKKDTVNVDYVYYYFSQRNINAYINKLSSQSSQPNLNLDLLGKLEFDLKHIDEQQKIASVLSALDSKIELNNRINAELEAMAKTLYDYWFVQFDFPVVTSSGVEKPYKTSGGKMVWNEELKREIPEGWEVKSLGVLGNFKNGVNYDPSNPGEIACPIINVRNISASSYFLKNEDLDIIYLKESDVRKYSVHEGSIIIARSGIPGATRLISDIAENTLYCGFAIHYELQNLNYKIPIFFYLKSIEQQIQNGSGGTILKNVNQGTLNALMFALPTDILIIQKFNELIQPIFSKINLIQKENQKLTELRDWLLPMLMNGQVKVNEAKEYTLPNETLSMVAEGE
jgi:type I restriction enzyme S subunit